MMYLVYRSYNNLDNLRHSTIAEYSFIPESYPNGAWFSGDDETEHVEDYLPIKCVPSENVECAFLSNQNLTIYSKNQNLRRHNLERHEAWNMLQWIIRVEIELSDFEAY